ncbi:MAG: hypothetical protein ACYCYF_10590 [Anaerolineae bacterium]
MQTVYVLFFSELGRRRLRMARCTRHPTSAWVVPQARQLSWQVQDGVLPIRFCVLIHDRDSKFCPSFDTVFKSEGVEIVRTPYRAPNANAFAPALDPLAERGVSAPSARLARTPPAARAPSL